MTFVLEDAKREQARLRLGMSGGPGAGKTWSALLVARGLAQYLVEQGQIASVADAIAVIDTERRSSELYAHLVPFKILALDPPHSTERYVEALEVVEKAGRPICIMDQITFAWSGLGGVLDKVDQIQQTSNLNSFSAWKKGTPLQQRFIDRLLRSECHLICTMRSRTEWVLELNSKGKQEPRAVGTVPGQRKGIAYEFTTFLAIDNEEARKVKDRTGLFREPRTLTDEDGRRLGEWLLSGAPTTDRDDVGGAGTPGADQAALELEAKRLDLNVAVSQRADALALAHGMDPKKAAAGVRLTLRKAVKLEKGRSPTLEQVNQMLVLVADATVTSED